MTHEDRLGIHLEGRIFALERVVQSLIVELMLRLNPSDPVAQTALSRQYTMASLQHLERPIDERSDAIWDEGVKSLDHLFAVVREHLEQIANER